jgi:hypothetical protein
MAIIQKKCPAEAGQYFQAECYDLRFHRVGCLWFFLDRIGFGLVFRLDKFGFGFSFGFGLTWIRIGFGFRFFVWIGFSVF